jgi:DNA-binding transcriptional regulator YhcF (GntR family)
MGGLNEGTPPSPAPEYPPENTFDPAVFANVIGTELKKIGTPAFNDESLSTAIAEGLMKVLAFTWKWSPMGISTGAPLMDDPQAFYVKILKVIGEVVVRMVVEGGKPLMDILGGLTSFYTGEIVSELAPVTRSDAAGAPTGLSGGAQALFDGVMSPLMGLTAARNPAESGAGMANAQYTLGGIIGIHLHTWMVNILSNITGIGVLKFINSFDECITGSLNARALGRGAMKPYLEKFIATPLTNDLNVAMPLAIGSASQLIKRYLRGNITAEDLKAALRKQGYDDEVVADQLLDAAKLLSVSQVVYLVKTGQWTVENAYTALQQAGYPLALAVAAYEIESNSRVDSQHDALADDLLTLYKDHRLDREAFVSALQSAGFTDAEIQAYSLRGAYAQEIPKRLTYTQVKSLYAESLVDLNYVTDFLTAEGYSNTDADLLVLHEFTKKEERDRAIKLLASIRRAQLEAGLKDQAAADAARKAALALLSP